MNKRNWLMVSGLALAMALVQGCGSVQEGDSTDDTPDSYVRLPIAVVTEEFTERTGFNRDEVQDDEYVFGYLPFATTTRLRPEENAKLVVLDEALLRHNRVDPKTLKVVPDTQDNALELNTLQTPSAHHNYVALYQEMKNLQSQYSASQALYTAGEAWVNITCPDAAHPRVSGTSTCRRQLWATRISSTPTVTTDKPRINYVANMHGDEVMGRELMLRLIDLLGVGTDPDPQINAMLAALRSNAEILIMPSLNPDGYEAQKRNDCWRSNGTNHATCYTGSDLNRSFPNKQTNQSDSSSGRPVEVVAMMDRFFKSKPESFGATLVPYSHPFVLGANFHGGTTVMNLAYDTCPNTGSPTAGCASYYPDSGAIFDDDLEVKSLGREYANLNPVMNAIADTGSFYNGLTYGYEWYLIAGGMQDWATVYSGRDSIHTTVELTTTKWPTFASATEGVAVSWANNKLALVTYLYRGLKGIHVAVVDSAGQPINGATVAINGRAITYGATNKIHHAAGRSVSPANAGYNASQKAAYLGGTPVDADSPISVTVSAPGRTTAIVPVSPSIFAGDYTTVTLQ